MQHNNQHKQDRIRKLQNILGLMQSSGFINLIEEVEKDREEQEAIYFRTPLSDFDNKRLCGTIYLRQKLRELETELIGLTRSS